MYICSDHFTPDSFLPIKGLGRRKLKPNAVPSIFPKFPQHLQVSPKPKRRSPKKRKIVEPPTPSKLAKEHLYACQSEFDPNKSKQEIVHLKKKVSALRAKIQRRNQKIKNMDDLLKVLKEQKLVIEQGKGICFDKNLSAAIQSVVVEQLGSAVFHQSQEHFFDHSLSTEADHLTTLLRLVTEKYVLLRLKTYSKRFTEMVVHKNEPSLRHRLTKTILFKNQ